MIFNEPVDKIGVAMDVNSMLIRQNPTRQGDGAGRALRRGAPGLLAAVTIAALAACSSSSVSGTSSATSSSASSSATASASATGSASSSPLSTAGLSQYLPGSKAAGTPVKVGLINNEGASASAAPNIGDAAVAAAQYASDELGGIAGHPIQVIRCGEQEDTASSTACANEMVQDNVAVAVLGEVSTGNVIVPIITKAGIPYVTVTGTSSAEMSTPGAFSWSGGYEATLTGIAQYARQQGYKKVTAFVVNLPSAIAGAKSLGVAVFKANGVALSIEPVPAGVPDATSQVTAGLSGSPDAVATILDETTCTSVLKSVKLVNPTVPVLGITNCLDSASVQALGSAMNGIKIFGSSSPQSSDAQARLYQYVMARYAPKVSTAGITVVGFQSMLGLVRAAAGLKGSPTPASITAAVKAARNVPLPAGGGISFTCNGKALPSLPSICSMGEVMVTVQNGIGVNPQIFG
jgi:branched-chain amino acid transport system substrate-binding protein